MGTQFDSPSGSKTESPISGIPHTKLNDDDGFEVSAKSGTSPTEHNDGDGFEEIPTKEGETSAGDTEPLTKKAAVGYSTDCDWCSVCVIIIIFFLAAVVAFVVPIIGEALYSTPAPTSSPLPTFSPSVAPTGCNTTCFSICESYCTVEYIKTRNLYSKFCRDMCEYHGDSEDECEEVCFLRLVLDCEVDCAIDCDC